MNNQPTFYKTFKDFVSLPLAFAVPYISFLIYASTYLYQKHFNQVYNIPADYVTIDINKISNSLFYILLFLGVNFIIFNISGYLYKNRLKVGSRDWVLAGAVMILCIDTIIYLILLTLVLKGLVAAKLLVIVFLSATLLAGAFKFNSLLGRSKPINNENKFKLLINYLKYDFTRTLGYTAKSIFLAMSTILFLLGAQTLGAVMAVTKTNYIVNNSNHNQVVVNTYGDKFIVATIDRIDPRGVYSYLKPGFIIVDANYFKDGMTTRRIPIMRSGSDTSR